MTFECPTASPSVFRLLLLIRILYQESLFVFVHSPLIPQSPSPFPKSHVPPLDPMIDSKLSIVCQSLGLSSITLLVFVVINETLGL
ncbi:hypothetical protein BD410DRAFT_267397 [Rickenella mellea]|uniref:Uncharacterized protein n=1 Tax=Rickenella mellea TaxID=50990 RepID=A0A4Y7Q3A5_9AGAM|nr:hypothetical protein BD410DRAFT_267397 [Rickenella mellea]